MKLLISCTTLGDWLYASSMRKLLSSSGWGSWAASAPPTPFRQQQSADARRIPRNSGGSRQPFTKCSEQQPAVETHDDERRDPGDALEERPAGEPAHLATVAGELDQRHHGE